MLLAWTILVLAVCLFNGLLMVATPRTWFRLPRFFTRNMGPLDISQKRDRIRIRLTGGASIFVGLFGLWVMARNWQQETVRSTPVAVASHRAVQVWDLKAVIGLIFIAGIMVLFLVNGIIMIRDPERWMKLPDYVGFHGTLRYIDVSTPSGRREVRVRSSLYLAVSLLFFLIMGSALGWF